MISFAHFTKQSCTIIDILIIPDSQYSYRKRITRGHIMFAFKIDKVLFTGLHCTPGEVPKIHVIISTQRKLWEGVGEGYLHRLKRKKHHSIK